MRFGLVGTGYWAHVAHAPALSSTAGVEFTGLAAQRLGAQPPERAALPVGQQRGGFGVPGPRRRVAGQVGVRAEQAGVPGHAAEQPGVLVVHDTGPGQAVGVRFGGGEAVGRTGWVKAGGGQAERGRDQAAERPVQRLAGHGGGKPTAKLIEETADIFDFARQAIAARSAAATAGT